MSRIARLAWRFALAAAVGATLVARAAEPVSEPVHAVDGEPAIGANDLARLLGASKFWRGDVRKLVLRAGAHRVTLTQDLPLVLVDGRIVLLPAAVRSQHGELQVPIALLASLPTDSGGPRLVFDAGSRRVRAVGAAGFVGEPKVADDGHVARVTFPVERAGAAEVTGRSRARFRLRVPGVFTAALPDSLPEGGLVRDLRVRPLPEGVAFELALDAAAQAYRLDRDEAAGRVTLTILRTAEPGMERFAAEAPPGPHPLRVVVLDPGHGGADAGAQAGGLVEKSLALDLAHALATELGHRTGARLVLTRADDRELSQEQRAEIANRARADLVIAIHFDAFAGSRATGATVYCAPASLAAGGGGEPSGGPSTVALVPWRDVALVRAVESRGLAEAVAAAIEQRGLGPVRVRERLPLPLVGVAAPGVELECAMLSDPVTRARLAAPNALRTLAVAIADAVVAWQRGD